MLLLTVSTLPGYLLDRNQAFASPFVAEAGSMAPNTAVALPGAALGRPSVSDAAACRAFRAKIAAFAGPARAAPVVHCNE